MKPFGFLQATERSSITHNEPKAISFPRQIFWNTMKEIQIHTFKCFSIGSHDGATSVVGTLSTNIEKVRFIKILLLLISLEEKLRSTQGIFFKRDGTKLFHQRKRWNNVEAKMCALQWSQTV